MKKALLIGIIALLFVGTFVWTKQDQKGSILSDVSNSIANLKPENEGGIEKPAPHPLSIEALRNGEYPGSDLVIEQTLSPGSNYSRAIVSYKSEGLKIYALLTIPNGEKPTTGWPVVVFNHGYIPPAQYRTTERYISYTDAFSRSGYILIRPDYRGHGNSEGEAAGGYGSSAYTVDVLNALASVKKHPDADPARIGMWGHSMGGFITLRSMVVNKDIKAGVIWGGVVGSYSDMLNNWRRNSSNGATPTPFPLPTGARRWRQALVEEYGEPDTNPDFWNSISANAFLEDISGPLQLHHGESDSTVPVQFTKTLGEQMNTAGKSVEVFTYPGDDHDITASFGTAMRRSVEFFDTHVKGK